MPQYILIVEYDGSRFYGFQRQHSKTADNFQENTSNNQDVVFKTMKKKPRVDYETGRKLSLDNPKMTIQDCLETSILYWLSSVLEEVESLTWSLKQLTFRFAGRTDKGVHARGQVVTIELPKHDSIPASCWQIQKAINGRLPVDISINDIFQSAPGKEIHPRSDAKHKQYSYTIRFQRREADNHHHSTENTTTSSGGGCISSQTFRQALSDSPCLWTCPWALEDSKLSEICPLMQGTHDYSAFVHKHERAKTDNTLTVTRFDFEVLQVITPNNNSNFTRIFMDCPTASTNDDNDDDVQHHPVIVLGKFWIESKGFRRNMVRNMVGFAVDVCRGVQSQEEIESLWTATDEAAAKVKAAPASGLCLEYVKY